MALLDAWREKAYQEQDKVKMSKLWQAYFLKEKEIYQELLKNPDEEVKGTVAELAEKYDLSIMYMTAFLDGIDEQSFKVGSINPLLILCHSLRLAFLKSFND